MSSLEFVVKVRPPIHLQEAENIGLYVDPTSEKIIVGNKYFFTADHGLSSNQQQTDVYDRFSSSVVAFLEGYNVSFITLGRSKSGKTYSLVGPLASHGCNDKLKFGLLPRTALHMFDYLKRAQQTSERRFNVFFSFFEAPYEDVQLSDRRYSDVSQQKSSTELPINNNITSKECNSFEDVLNCLQMVMKNGPFDRSQHSESSHKNYFFMLTLHQHFMESGKMLAKSSRCTFVDLNSYESSYSYAMNNQGIQNLKFANSGLDLVSRVLSSLTDNVNSSSLNAHLCSVVPILLKDIIMYCTKTTLLFCVSPSSIDASNSLNDLVIFEQMRLLYGNPIHEKSIQNHNLKIMNQNERDSAKEEALSLEFAASQWQLLVSNAETLFNKLVQGGLSADAKGQIEQWLFLKQECEDCFKHDASGPERNKCSLDPIDEVTESECKTSTENDGDSEPDNDDSDDLENSHKNDFTPAQSETKKKEFAEKLKTHLKRFRAITDELVWERHTSKSVRLYNETNPIDRKCSTVNKRATSMKSSLPFSTTHVENEDSEKAKLGQDCAFQSSSSIGVNAGAEVEIPDVNSLRIEIASLRVTKDYMHEQKRELTVKMNETKYITNEEQRKLIEADEAIDAIDSAMEFKNELLCGRSVLSKSDLQEWGEQMLTERLLNLNCHEMRILLCKYFKKVVDLREAGRKMEKVIADQDHQLETQAFKIHALGNALQQTRVECERRLVMVLKEQEKKYQVNFHHYGTDSSGASSSVDNKSDQFSNAGPLFELNGVSAPPTNAVGNALTIPQQNIKKLQGSSTHTTKVTRKGNKLIIQQERSKKK